jgi:hypothetical protein
MVIYLTMLIHTGEMMERGLVGHAIGIITGDTMCEDNLCSKCGYKFPRPIEDALRAELDAKDAEIVAVMDIVRVALKDYPMFNSERCVSALLKIRKIIEPPEVEP